MCTGSAQGCAHVGPCVCAVIPVLDCGAWSEFESLGAMAEVTKILVPARFWFADTTSLVCTHPRMRTAWGALRCSVCLFCRVLALCASAPVLSRTLQGGPRRQHSRRCKKPCACCRLVLFVHSYDVCYADARCMKMLLVSQPHGVGAFVLRAGSALCPCIVLVFCVLSLLLAGAAAASAAPVHIDGHRRTAGTCTRTPWAAPRRSGRGSGPACARRPCARRDAHRHAHTHSVRTPDPYAQCVPFCFAVCVIRAELNHSACCPQVLDGGASPAQHLLTCMSYDAPRCVHRQVFANRSIGPWHRASHAWRCFCSHVGGHACVRLSRACLLVALSLCGHVGTLHHRHVVLFRSRCVTRTPEVKTRHPLSCRALCVVFPLGPPCVLCRFCAVLCCM